MQCLKQTLHFAICFSSIVTDHFKAFQIIPFRFAYAAFLTRYADLILNSIHPVKIREQQAPLIPMADDNTIAFYIELIRRIYRFQFP